MNIIRTPRTALCLALIAGALSAFVSSTIADEVTLRDGTIHNGKVVSQNRRTVEIDTEIHGISTRLKIDRRKVKSIVIGDSTPSTTPSTTNETPSNSINTTPGIIEQKEEPKALKRDGYNLLLEVPLEGTFGQDIYPLSIADSLEWAKENGVTDVVFRINSGGGEVWCAKDMVEIMNDYRGDFKMHMLIESAISASIWPSFNCDTITMAPGSDFGGAVVYRMNTGSAEVDKKMNSIWANKLASAADARGHLGLLVPAMIVSDNAVYAYKDPSGQWAFSDTTEGLPPNYETIDGPDTILTLTQKQALKYGLVQGLTDGNTLEEFCKVQGIDKWDNAGQYAYETSEKDVKKCKRLRDQLEAIITGFYREAAILGDRNYVMTYGSSLQTMRKQLGQYKRLIRQAEQLHMPSILDSFEEAIDTTYWENEIETRMAELRRLRRGP